jgi:hypothetical protein
VLLLPHQVSCRPFVRLRPATSPAKKNNYHKNNSKQGNSNEQQGGSNKQYHFFTAPMAANPWLGSLQLYGAPRAGGSGLHGNRPGMPP